MSYKEAKANWLSYPHEARANALRRFQGAIEAAEENSGCSGLEAAFAPEVAVAQVINPMVAALHILRALHESAD